VRGCHTVRWCHKCRIIPGVAAFRIRVGDQLPVLEGRATFKHNGKQQAFNFTEWKSLTFTATGPREITGAATGTSDGILMYQWTPADTTTPGNYKGKFKGYDEKGRPQTFPTKGSIEIVIEPT
jgi:hypothetical protein